LGSTEEHGNNGACTMPFESFLLHVMASDGMGWEHVSVSLNHRTPHWREMGCIKDVCWDADDVVMQSHPAKSEYVNQHEHCLHLWRPVGQVIPTPPKALVGQENGAARIPLF
jgi:hypothetical protein